MKIDQLCKFGAIAVAAAMMAGACEPTSEPAPAEAASVPAPSPVVETPAVPAPPASPLTPYSQKPDGAISFAADPVITNYFCQSIGSASCDDAAKAALAAEGFTDGKSVVDLGLAATMVAVRKAPGAASGPIADEPFVTAAYKVVLGREPDPAGLTANMDWLKASNDRRQAVRGLIQSEEYRLRPI